MSADKPEPASYTTRPLKWAHHREEGWMSDFSTMIEIRDEGEGEFLHLWQPFAHVDLAAGGIAITPEEWPTLKEAIEHALNEISNYEEAEVVEVAAAFKTQKSKRDKKI